MEKLLLSLTSNNFVKYIVLPKILGIKSVENFIPTKIVLINKVSENQ